MKALLIGGGGDGRFIECKEPIPPKFYVPGYLGFSLQGDLPFCKKEVYVRHYLFSGEKKYPVFLIEREHPSNIIPLLIQGYRRV